MIVQDALYHKICLASLYRKASNKQLGSHYSEKQRKLAGIALGEDVVFIEETFLTATNKDYHLSFRI